jgi:putative membrane protein
MWWHGGEGWGWWMVFGGIAMLIFWGLIIWLVVWGITRLTENKRSSGGTDTGRSPLDIAKERYARGEITKEQFDQMKKDLS